MEEYDFASGALLIAVLAIPLSVWDFPPNTPVLLEGERNKLLEAGPLHSLKVTRKLRTSIRESYHLDNCRSGRKKGLDRTEALLKIAEVVL